jgi:hypothetical protein
MLLYIRLRAKLIENKLLLDMNLPFSSTEDALSFVLCCDRNLYHGATTLVCLIEHQTVGSRPGHAC